MRTDAEEYVAEPVGSAPGYQQYQFRLIARLENQSTQVVYLERCFPDSPTPIYGVLFVEGGAGSAYDQPWGCVGHGNQIEVAPGASRTDTLLMQGPNMFPSGGGQGFGEVQGRFRLVYHVLPCTGFYGCPRIADAGRSNTFRVALTAGGR